MPQTYIRAVTEGAVGRTSPVAVSYSRSGGAEPGTEGNVVGDQDCITTNYALWPVPASQTTSVTPRTPPTDDKPATGPHTRCMPSHTGCGPTHGLQGRHTGCGPTHRLSGRHTDCGRGTRVRTRVRCRHAVCQGDELCADRGNPCVDTPCAGPTTRACADRGNPCASPAARVPARGNRSPHTPERPGPRLPHLPRSGPPPTPPTCVTSSRPPPGRRTGWCTSGSGRSSSCAHGRSWRSWTARSARSGRPRHSSGRRR